MENGRSGRTHEVLYVYDRICPKESKKRELYREYGVRRTSANNASGTNRPRANANADPRVRRGGGPSAVRDDGRVRHDGPASHSRPRVDEGARRDAGYRGRTTSPGGAGAPRYRGEDVPGARRPRTEQHNFKSCNTDRERQRRDAHAYNYRPKSPSRGGEAVASRPLKLILERIVNMFESIEDRGRLDELSAKRQAIYRKKLYESRHAIGTALLLLAIVVAFVFIVYKTFFVITDIDASGATLYSSESVIAASGILEGDNLYSFASTDAEDRITFMCPYIKSADVTRTVPNSVSITVEEDTAMYVAEIYGERVILSEGLRVLGKAGDTSASGLTHIVLPPVDYSVAGRVLTFADEKNERFIREVLSAVSKDSYFDVSDIDRIDFTNGNDIKITVAGKYVFKLGSEADCSLKLRMAEKTITNTSFDKTKPATIDLSRVGEASVRYDPKLFSE